METRTLRRGPRCVVDGQPVKIPAPPGQRLTCERDTGTKGERLCGWPSNRVGLRPETGVRVRGFAPNRVFWSRQARKARTGSSIGRPYRKPTQVGEASSLR